MYWRGSVYTQAFTMENYNENSLLDHDGRECKQHDSHAATAVKTCNKSLKVYKYNSFEDSSHKKHEVKCLKKIRSPSKYLLLKPFGLKVRKSVISEIKPYIPSQENKHTTSCPELAHRSTEKGATGNSKSFGTDLVKSKRKVYLYSNNYSENSSSVSQKHDKEIEGKEISIPQVEQQRNHYIQLRNERSSSRQSYNAQKKPNEDLKESHEHKGADREDNISIKQNPGHVIKPDGPNKAKKLLRSKTFVRNTQNVPEFMPIMNYFSQKMLGKMPKKHLETKSKYSRKDTDYNILYKNKKKRSHYLPEQESKSKLKHETLKTITAIPNSNAEKISELEMPKQSSETKNASLFKESDCNIPLKHMDASVYHPINKVPKLDVKDEIVHLSVTPPKGSIKKYSEHIFNTENYKVLKTNEIRYCHTETGNEDCSYDSEKLLRKLKNVSEKQKQSKESLVQPIQESGINPRESAKETTNLKTPFHFTLKPVKYDSFRMQSPDLEKALELVHLNVPKNKPRLGVSCIHNTVEFCKHDSLHIFKKKQLKFKKSKPSVSDTLKQKELKESTPKLYLTKEKKVEHTESQDKEEEMLKQIKPRKLMNLPIYQEDAALEYTRNETSKVNDTVVTQDNVQHRAFGKDETKVALSGPKTAKINKMLQSESAGDEIKISNLSMELTNTNHGGTNTQETLRSDAKLASERKPENSYKKENNISASHSGQHLNDTETKDTKVSECLKKVTNQPNTWHIMKEHREQEHPGKYSSNEGMKTDFFDQTKSAEKVDGKIINSSSREVLQSYNTQVYKHIIKTIVQPEVSQNTDYILEQLESDRLLKENDTADSKDHENECKLLNKDVLVKSPTAPYKSLSNKMKMERSEQSKHLSLHKVKYLADGFVSSSEVSLGKNKKTVANESLKASTRIPVDVVSLNQPSVSVVKSENQILIKELVESEEAKALNVVRKYAGDILKSSIVITPSHIESDLKDVKLTKVLEVTPLECLKENSNKPNISSVPTHKTPKKEERKSIREPVRPEIPKSPVKEPPKEDGGKKIVETCIKSQDKSQKKEPDNYNCIAAKKIYKPHGPSALSKEYTTSGYVGSGNKESVKQVKKYCLKNKEKLTEKYTSVSPHSNKSKEDINKPVNNITAEENKQQCLKGQYILKIKQIHSQDTLNIDNTKTQTETKEQQSVKGQDTVKIKGIQSEDTQNIVNSKTQTETKKQQCLKEQDTVKVKGIHSQDVYNIGNSKTQTETMRQDTVKIKGIQSEVTQNIVNLKTQTETKEQQCLKGQDTVKVKGINSQDVYNIGNSKTQTETMRNSKTQIETMRQDTVKIKGVHSQDTLNIVDTKTQTETKEQQFLKGQDKIKIKGIHSQNTLNIVNSKTQTETKEPQYLKGQDSVKIKGVHSQDTHNIVDTKTQTETKEQQFLKGQDKIKIKGIHSQNTLNIVNLKTQTETKEPQYLKGQDSVKIKRIHSQDTQNIVNSKTQTETKEQQFLKGQDKIKIKGIHSQNTLNIVNSKTQTETKEPQYLKGQDSVKIKGVHSQDTQNIVNSKTQTETKEQQFLKAQDKIKIKGIHSQNTLNIVNSKTQTETKEPQYLKGQDSVKIKGVHSQDTHNIVDTKRQTEMKEQDTVTIKVIHSQDTHNIINNKIQTQTKEIIEEHCIDLTTRQNHSTAIGAKKSTNDLEREQSKSITHQHRMEDLQPPMAQDKYINKETIRKPVNKWMFKIKEQFLKPGLNSQSSTYGDNQIICKDVLKANDSVKIDISSPPTQTVSKQGDEMIIKRTIIPEQSKSLLKTMKKNTCKAFLPKTEWNTDNSNKTSNSPSVSVNHEEPQIIKWTVIPKQSKSLLKTDILSGMEWNTDKIKISDPPAVSVNLEGSQVIKKTVIPEHSPSLCNTAKSICKELPPRKGLSTDNKNKTSLYSEVADNVQEPKIIKQTVIPEHSTVTQTECNEKPKTDTEMVCGNTINMTVSRDGSSHTEDRQEEQNISKDSLTTKAVSRDGSIHTEDTQDKQRMNKYSLTTKAVSRDGSSHTEDTHKKTKMNKDSLATKAISRDGSSHTEGTQDKQKMNKDSLTTKDVSRDGYSHTEDTQDKQKKNKDSLTSKAVSRDGSTHAEVRQEKQKISKNSFPTKTVSRDGSTHAEVTQEKQMISKNSLTTKDVSWDSFTHTEDIEDKQKMNKNVLTTKAVSSHTEDKQEKQIISKNSLATKAVIEDGSTHVEDTQEKQKISKDSLTTKAVSRDGATHAEDTQEKQKISKNLLTTKDVSRDGFTHTEDTQDKQKMNKDSLTTKAVSSHTEDKQEKQIISKNSLATKAVIGDGSTHVEDTQEKQKISKDSLTTKAVTRDGSTHMEDTQEKQKISKDSSTPKAVSSHTEDKPEKQMISKMSLTTKAVSRDASTHAEDTQEKQKISKNSLPTKAVFREGSIYIEYTQEKQKISKDSLTTKAVSRDGSTHTEDTEDKQKINKDSLTTKAVTRDGSTHTEDTQEKQRISKDSLTAKAVSRNGSSHLEDTHEKKKISKNVLTIKAVSKEDTHTKQKISKCSLTTKAVSRDGSTHTEDTQEKQRISKDSLTTKAVSRDGSSHLEDTHEKQKIIKYSLTTKAVSKEDTHTKQKISKCSLTTKAVSRDGLSHLEDTHEKQKISKCSLTTKAVSRDGSTHTEDTQEKQKNTKGSLTTKAVCGDGSTHTEDTQEKQKISKDSLSIKATKSEHLKPETQQPKIEDVYGIVKSESNTKTQAASSELEKPVYMYTLETVTAKRDTRKPKNTGSLPEKIVFPKIITSSPERQAIATNENTSTETKNVASCKPIKCVMKLVDSGTNVKHSVRAKTSDTSMIEKKRSQEASKFQGSNAAAKIKDDTDTTKIEEKYTEPILVKSEKKQSTSSNKKESREIMNHNKFRAQKQSLGMEELIESRKQHSKLNTNYANMYEKFMSYETLKSDGSDRTERKQITGATTEEDKYPKSEVNQSEISQPTSSAIVELKDSVIANESTKIEHSRQQIHINKSKDSPEAVKHPPLPKTEETRVLETQLLQDNLGDEDVQTYMRDDKIQEKVTNEIMNQEFSKALEQPDIIEEGQESIKQQHKSQNMIVANTSQENLKDECSERAICKQNETIQNKSSKTRIIKSQVNKYSAAYSKKLKGKVKVEQEMMINNFKDAKQTSRQNITFGNETFFHRRHKKKRSENVKRELEDTETIKMLKKYSRSNHMKTKKYTSPTAYVKYLNSSKSPTRGVVNQIYSRDSENIREKWDVRTRSGMVSKVETLKVVVKKGTMRTGTSNRSLSKSYDEKTSTKRENIEPVNEIPKMKDVQERLKKSTSSKTQDDNVQNMGITVEERSNKDIGSVHTKKKPDETEHFNTQETHCKSELMKHSAANADALNMTTQTEGSFLKTFLNPKESKPAVSTVTKEVLKDFQNDDGDVVSKKRTIIKSVKSQDTPETVRATTHISSSQAKTEGTKSFQDPAKREHFKVAKKALKAEDVPETVKLKKRIKTQEISNIRAGVCQNILRGEDLQTNERKLENAEHEKYITVTNKSKETIKMNLPNELKQKTMTEGKRTVLKYQHTGNVQDKEMIKATAHLDTLKVKGSNKAEGKFEDAEANTVQQKSLKTSFIKSPDTHSMSVGTKVSNRDLVDEPTLAENEQHSSRLKEKNRRRFTKEINQETGEDVHSRVQVFKSKIPRPSPANSNKSTSSYPTHKEVRPGIEKIMPNSENVNTPNPPISTVSREDKRKNTGDPVKVTISRHATHNVAKPDESRVYKEPAKRPHFKTTKQTFKTENVQEYTSERLLPEDGNMIRKVSWQDTLKDLERQQSIDIEEQMQHMNEQTVVYVNKTGETMTTKSLSQPIVSENTRDTMKPQHKVLDGKTNKSPEYLKSIRSEIISKSEDKAIKLQPSIMKEDRPETAKTNTSLNAHKGRPSDKAVKIPGNRKIIRLNDKSCKHRFVNSHANEPTVGDVIKSTSSGHPTNKVQLTEHPRVVKYSTKVNEPPNSEVVQETQKHSDKIKKQYVIASKEKSQKDLKSINTQQKYTRELEDSEGIKERKEYSENKVTTRQHDITDKGANNRRYSIKVQYSKSECLPVRVDKTSLATMTLKTIETHLVKTGRLPNTLNNVNNPDGTKLSILKDKSFKYRSINSRINEPTDDALKSSISGQTLKRVPKPKDQRVLKDSSKEDKHFNSEKIQYLKSDDMQLTLKCAVENKKPNTVMIKRKGLPESITFVDTEKIIRTQEKSEMVQGKDKYLKSKLIREDVTKTIDDEGSISRKNINIKNPIPLSLVTVIAEDDRILALKVQDKNMINENRTLVNTKTAVLQEGADTITIKSTNSCHPSNKLPKPEDSVDENNSTKVGNVNLVNSLPKSEDLQGMIKHSARTKKPVISIIKSRKSIDTPKDSGKAESAQVIEEHETHSKSRLTKQQHINDKTHINTNNPTETITIQHSTPIRQPILIDKNKNVPFTHKTQDNNIDKPNISHDSTPKTESSKKDAIIQEGTRPSDIEHTSSKSRSSKVQVNETRASEAIKSTTSGHTVHKVSTPEESKIVSKSTMEHTNTLNYPHKSEESKIVNKSTMEHTNTLNYPHKSVEIQETLKEDTMIIKSRRSMEDVKVIDSKKSVNETKHSETIGQQKTDSKTGLKKQQHSNYRSGNHGDVPTDTIKVQHSTPIRQPILIDEDLSLVVSTKGTSMVKANESPDQLTPGSSNKVSKIPRRSEANAMQYNSSKTRANKLSKTEKTAANDNELKETTSVRQMQSKNTMENTENLVKDTKLMENSNHLQNVPGKLKDRTSATEEHIKLSKAHHSNMITVKKLIELRNRNNFKCIKQHSKTDTIQKIVKHSHQHKSESISVMKDNTPQETIRAGEITDYSNSKCKKDNKGENKVTFITGRSKSAPLGREYFKGHTNETYFDDSALKGIGSEIKEKPMIILPIHMKTVSEKKLYKHIRCHSKLVKFISATDNSKELSIKTYPMKIEKELSKTKDLTAVKRKNNQQVTKPYLNQVSNDSIVSKKHITKLSSKEENTQLASSSKSPPSGGSNIILPTRKELTKPKSKTIIKNKNFEADDPNAAEITIKKGLKTINLKKPVIEQPKYTTDGFKKSDREPDKPPIKVVMVEGLKKTKPLKPDVSEKAPATVETGILNSEINKHISEVKLQQIEHLKNISVHNNEVSSKVVDQSDSVKKNISHTEDKGLSIKEGPTIAETMKSTDRKMSRVKNSHDDITKSAETVEQKITDDQFFMKTISMDDSNDIINNIDTFKKSEEPVIAEMLRSAIDKHISKNNMKLIANVENALKSNNLKKDGTYSGIPDQSDSIKSLNRIHDQQLSAEKGPPTSEITEDTNKKASKMKKFHDQIVKSKRLQTILKSKSAEIINKETSEHINKESVITDTNKTEMPLESTMKVGHQDISKSLTKQITTKLPSTSNSLTSVNKGISKSRDEKLINEPLIPKDTKQHDRGHTISAGSVFGGKHVDSKKGSVVDLMKVEGLQHKVKTSTYPFLLPEKQKEEVKSPSAHKDASAIPKSKGFSYINSQYLKPIIPKLSSQTVVFLSAPNSRSPMTDLTAVTRNYLKPQNFETPSRKDLTEHNYGSMKPSESIKRNKIAETTERKVDHLEKSTMEVKTPPIVVETKPKDLHMGEENHKTSNIKTSSTISNTNINKNKMVNQNELHRPRRDVPRITKESSKHHREEARVSTNECIESECLREVIKDLYLVECQRDIVTKTFREVHVKHPNELFEPEKERKSNVSKSNIPKSNIPKSNIPKSKGDGTKKASDPLKPQDKKIPQKRTMITKDETKPPDVQMPEPAAKSSGNGGSSNWDIEEPRLMGISHYFNSSTIRGRANVAKATFVIVGLLSLYFFFKPKPAIPPPCVEPKSPQEAS